MSADSGAANPDAQRKLQDIIEAMPYAQTLGIAFRFEAGCLRTRLPSAGHLLGNPVVRSVHGGAIGSLLQITARAQAMIAIKSDSMPRMFACSIEYLQAAQAAELFAVATVMSRSRRYANVRAVAFQEREDQPVAAATVQLLLVD